LSNTGRKNGLTNTNFGRQKVEKAVNLYLTKALTYQMVQNNSAEGLAVLKSTMAAKNRCYFLALTHCWIINQNGGVMTRVILSLMVGMLVMAGSAAFAQEPMRDVNPRRHPNIAAAQKLTQKAYDRIVAAQQANEGDMEGHAQKAKELLDQVNHELKEAAEAANRHRGRDRDHR
jgi:hypothetical protein